MKQNIMTIVTSIERNSVEELRQLLKTEFKVEFCEATQQVTCQGPLDFCALKTLHFASFVILDRCDEFDPCLVFEATFDGTKQAFLDDLIKVAPGAVAEIYKHCVGFPVSFAELPHLARQYFLDHNVAANVLFAGSPGRSASQILRESRLRNDIVEFLGEYRKNLGTTPASYAGIQRDIQRQVVRADWRDSSGSKDGSSQRYKANHGWADESYEPPFEVRHGHRVLGTVALALSFAALIVTAWIINQIYGLEPFQIGEEIDNWYGYVMPIIDPVSGLLGAFLYPVVKWLIVLSEPLAWTLFVLAVVWIVLRVLDRFLTSTRANRLERTTLVGRLRHSNLVAGRVVIAVLVAVIVASWLDTPADAKVRALLMIAVLWLGLRGGELLFRRRFSDPRATGFGLRLVRHGLFFARHVAYAALICFGSFEFAKGLMSAGSNDASGLLHLLNLDILDVWVSEEFGAFWQKSLKLPDDASIGQWLIYVSLAFLPLIAVFICWWKLNYWKTTLQVMVEFRHLRFWPETWRRFKVDAARAAMLVLLWVGGVYLLNRVLNFGWISVTYLDSVGELLAVVAQAILVVAFYGVVVVGAVYVVGIAVLVLIRFCEARDNRTYASAGTLLDDPMANVEAYAREEYGVNKLQNHLASLTYVKRGYFRILLLRVTLATINLLSRWWFNQGKLGGITTIIYARWVLLDGGKRLLFLDNFSGAWESYLNEFIDMSAVKGLNAIWTNTHLPKKDAGQAVNFPETKYYLWQGAQLERPFKAYVRNSQIETLLWYSAYPNLSITNINNNGAIRDAMFKDLKPDKLDALFRHL